MKKKKGSIRKFDYSIPNIDLKKNRVGIQIGEKSIKIIELKKEKNHWKTTKMIVEELPKGMVVEGKILQAELLGLKIKEIFSNNKISVKKVSVFMEELPFFIRNTHLPKMLKKEQRKAIYYHAQLEIPVNPSELTIRYSLFRNEDINKSVKKEYIIFAVYSALIEKVVQAIHAAGLSVYTFGLEPDAIYQGLKEKKIIEEEQAPFMIVRTDTQRMMLAIYNNQKLVYCRYVPFSLNRVDWEQEIQRTLVSWNGKNQDSRIQEVLLLGEKDHWDEVKKRIEEFMPISVRLVASPFTACLGISLKSREDNCFYTDKHTLGTQLPIAAKIGIPVAGVVIITLAYILLTPFLLQNDINKLEKKISENQDVLELVEKEDLLIQQNNEFTKMKADFEQNNLEVLNIVQNISTHMPANIHLTQLNTSQGLISMNGEGENQAAVIMFLKGLQENPKFQNVRLTQSGEGLTNVQFSIEIGKKQTSEDKDSEETK